MASKKLTPIRHTNRTAKLIRQTPRSAQTAAELTRKPKQIVYRKLDSCPTGLTDEEAQALREKGQVNRITGPHKDSKLKLLWRAVATPFNLVLLILAVMSFVTDVLSAPADQRDPSTFIIILTMIVASSIISFVQSSRSSDAVESLLDKIQITAAVTRNGETTEIPTDEIVPGDVVTVAAGDMVPADMRLVASKDLFCSTSSLNGESAPVEKTATPLGSSREGETYLDYPDVVYGGTTVVSGSGTGVVFAVGDDSVFGALAQSLSKDESSQTAFDTGIASVSKLLLSLTAAVVPLVFLINGFSKGSWTDALLFAIATAVGLTPEMLPVIVTSNLVRGSILMSHAGTIVKRMGAIQDFGSADVLATDKTGTLTENRIVLEKHLNMKLEESDEVLTYSYLNSFYQTGMRNLTDRAIVSEATKRLDIKTIGKAYEKVDEIPFDFERRRMSVVVRHTDGHRVLITKGAAEEMLACSTHKQVQGTASPLTGSDRQQTLAEVKKLNSQGLRVILISYKDNPRVAGELNARDESELTLIGYLAFLDPPKQFAKETVASMVRQGLRVKVLTGDNEAVTKAVCREVGIPTNTVLDGSEVESMSAEELTQKVDRCDIFVKLTPEGKTQVIRALRKAGHTVAFMGDGINDAPAMRAADVSVSVNTAVDVAKQAADIILLKSDLEILEEGVLLGRQVFVNTMKYIKITLSSNFGNILSVLIASIFLPFIPMLPLQLLILDLMYGISCVSIPFDTVSERACEQPRPWTTKGLLPFMFVFGPVSSLMDIVTFALLFRYVCPMIVGAEWVGATLSQRALFIAVFHAGWFIESLWTQEMVIHALREPGLPFIGQHAAPPVLWATFGMSVLGTVLPYSDLAEALDFGPLPGWYLVAVAGIMVLYLILVSFAKAAYIHKDPEREVTFL